MIPQRSDDRLDPEIIRFPQANPAQSPPGTASPTFADLLEPYFRSGQLKNKWTPAALAERKHTLGLFAEVVPGIPADEIPPYKLTDWIESKPSWKSSSTRKAKANQVNAVLNWAKKQKRIKENPLEDVDYEEAERRPCLTDDWLEKILLLCTEPMERVLRFLRWSGRRISDVADLNWQDVDWDKAKVILRKHKTKKKTKKDQFIALVPEALALLKQIHAEQTDLFGPPDPAAPIFVNTRGKRWNKNVLGQNLLRLKKRHGIDTPATLHGIRHQVGTEIVRITGSLPAAGAALGHAPGSAVTAKYYVHVDEDLEFVRKALNSANPSPAPPT